MLCDSHAHLDSGSLKPFVSTLNLIADKLKVISNSVDIESSHNNLEIAKGARNVRAFVGIHPEIFSRESSKKMNKEEMDKTVEELGELLALASGVGEIGLDPKYGRLPDQLYVLNGILKIAESTKLPLTFHNRETVSDILKILPSYKFKEARILFHWFAGSESELGLINDRGYFVSFGPSVIFSRRLNHLLEIADQNHILSETDSPTEFRSFLSGSIVPLLVGSVVFKMSLIKKMKFSEMQDLLEHNYLEYLGTQN